MKTLTRLTARFLKEESGATVVEYCLLIGLIALAIITAISAVGNPTQQSFEDAANSWPDA
ncbi:MAG: Flp family type IVb pilin [Hyphomonadaceae bacterium]|nr:Flp family type IVb pilin [Hyphomonadaceae bacterium]